MNVVFFFFLMIFVVVSEGQEHHGLFSLSLKGKTLMLLLLSYSSFVFLGTNSFDVNMFRSILERF